MDNWKTKLRTYLAEHSPDPLVRTWVSNTSHPLTFEEAVAYFSQTNEHISEAELLSLYAEIYASQDEEM